MTAAVAKDATVHYLGFKYIPLALYQELTRLYPHEEHD